MNRRNLFTSLTLLAFAFIFLRTAWVGDDAYITLRTVDNFVNGYGLTWNIAERVQSYTHPLWMFLLTMLYLPTKDAYLTALLASFIASTLTLWLVARRAGFAALAVLTLLLSKAFMDYSASGLENPLTHLLLVLFFIAFVEKKSSPLQLAFIASLIFLNRQDAILFALPALAFLAVPQNLFCASQCNTNGTVLRAFILGFLPLLLWEAFSLFYYGFPFPNTYYAKLGAGIPTNELIPQGFVYFLDSLQRDPLTLIIIAAGILFAFWRGQTRERLLALGSILYLAYVLSIGGDFMSGRFLTASLLVSALLLARLLPDLTPRWQYAAMTAVFLLGLLASPPNFILDLNRPRFTEHDLQTGINDERAYYYPISGLVNYRPGKAIPFSGEGWVEHGYALRASGKSVVDEKNVGFIGYFAGPAVHIVDLYALCDPLLARLPASRPEKWRIGHFERDVPAGYLQTLRTGVNQIQNPNRAKYYDALALITRGPLFSRERLIAVWKMNTGQFNFLLEPSQ
ncbi:MAG: Terminal beta-(1-_2)-arabinofuranosyltransferase [Anaerolineales bacterium]|nr:Terminal beta-(1->2)-arabinofuranosyltransferase [Anaerolineales bacterium]